MFERHSISVIIPALNEEQAIGSVIRSIPHWIDEIVVVDNGSTDATPKIAAQAGARVVLEPRRGYGQACLAGISAATDPDIIVFLDGDDSDDPSQMEALVAPIARGEADLVIGSRDPARAEPGSMTFPQRFGNTFACFLIRLLWGANFTDLGPFRAIRAGALRRMDMADRSYGWTVQMQVRAVKSGLRWKETPVRYRRRIGRSKISGTIRGVFGAGVKILYTVGKERSSRTPNAPARCLNQLIVFSRYPTPGATKTRLIPALGAEQAAAISHAMTARTLTLGATLADLCVCETQVRTTGAGLQDFRARFDPNLSYREQGSGDLGRRLHSAALDAFRSGATKVVIIGTDCPDLESAHVLEAFVRLDNDDVVIGPAQDGGYYLIGMRKMLPELFTDMEWGTARVLEQTRRRASALGVSLHELPVLRDVDQPEDLPILETRLAKDSAGRPVISVIIPAINEEETVVAAIRSASAAGRRVEIILADGGSTDRTVALARDCGAKIVHSARGRAAQMNAGAACATGDILVFLHADSVLPPDFAVRIVSAFEHHDTALAAFRLSIDSPRRGIHWIAQVANMRSRLGFPYGDQAFAVPAQLFRKLGGYSDIPIMEDFVLARQLRRHGAITILDATVVTSARRWLRGGVFGTTLVNQLCVLGFLLGISPTRLVRLRESLHRTKPSLDRAYEPYALIEEAG